MKIYIDGQEMDIAPSTVVSVSLSVAELTDLENSRTGYSRTIELPMTMHNRQIMGCDGTPGSVAQFNREIHTARIEKDGSMILTGAPCLMACEPDNGAGGCYRIAVVGASGSWARALAAISFREANVEFSETISGQMVWNSWSWEKPVRFLPVQRDSFVSESGQSVLFAPVRVLSFEDYHPFLHIRTVLETLFAQVGYKLRSEFVKSEMFDSLYMSGNYPAKEIEPLRRRMDFLAGRFAETETTADRFGRVYADPYRTINSIGNIVDTADPGESRDGVMLEGVYTINGCFGKDEERICFVPTEAVTLGFEYVLSYTTDYYMLDRNELRCFNIVSLVEGQECRYKVPNRNADRKAAFRSGYSYRIVVFGHEDGASYQFRYEDEGVTVTHSTFSSRSQEIVVYSDGMVSNPQLWVASGSTYALYEDDWALYDGYVEERGEIAVELKVRSTPERVLPSQPKYFDRIYFGGAEQGMKFRLKSDVTVRPLFAPWPCEGTKVEFCDVAAHEISGLDFVKGLKHLFNLWFYTDEVAKEVWMEPREEFCRRDVLVDWSSRIDFDRPVIVEDIGVGMAETIVFQYQDGDGAVARWNQENQQKIGRWKAGIENCFTEKGEQSCINPVFCASLNRTGDFPDAPNASLLQVGNRDLYTEEWSESLNFPAKVVRFFGMESLPNGEIWGWPSYGNSYPLVTFHTPEKDFSLCFEDRDGIEGLHRYYDRNFELYNQSSRLTVWLRLRPEEIEPLVNPDALMRDFRALFRLSIGGEHALYRLEEICDYNPEDALAKCLFIKEV